LNETLIGSGKHVAIPINETRPVFPEGWTPDGKQIVIRTGNAVRLVPALQGGASAAGESKAQTVFDETFVVDQIRVSRDGKWVAYTSQESGRPQIMVASFPSFTDRRQISTGADGASQPLWRADGRELFFLARDLYLMAVDVKPGATLETGSVHRLFPTTLNTTSQVHMYAVTRDGKKFLLRESLRGESNTVEPLYIVANWTSLVR
jgi:eukaryotic-like serine/threonine-protein kinase